MANELVKFYVGFNTRDYEDQGGTFEVYNVAVIERDLMNAIFTERGQRLMMPNYGTRIPLMTFEPGDQQTMDIILMDLKEVFDHEPRVKLVNLDIIPAVEKNALVAIAKVMYLEFNVTKDLMITINSR
jgi:phage baseplate assembly protein W